MSHSAYPYSQGDRLNDRNTYFYTEFRGAAFFEAWRASRSHALAALPAPVPIELAPCSAPAGSGYDTAKLLAYLLNTPSGASESDRLVENILQRFEVSKRIYRQYDAAFKAVRDSGYDDLDLYLRFAALCLSSRNRPAAVRFLNALLKAVDSLISVQDRLRPDQGARLAWLIAAEQVWVEHFAAGVGVRVTT